MLEIRTVTLTVRVKGDELVLACPEMGFNISFPRSNLGRGQPLMANLPALATRDGGTNVVVPPSVLAVLRTMQQDPALVDKLVAVTEAYEALET